MKRARATPSRVVRADHSAPTAPDLPACPPELALACAQDVFSPLASPNAVDGLEKDVALLAKALGHPARVKILRVLLARGECVCGDIVDALPLAQATVSQHLKVLKSAGLIRGTIQGPRTCYGANPERLEAFRSCWGDSEKGSGLISAAAR